MKLTLLISIPLFVLGLSSCSNMGSIALAPDRLSYNQSLSNSNEQQMLLNIVRLRYTDPPYFLSVNNIVSQFNFGSDFSVNVANSTPPPSLLGSGNAAFNYSESPTITYTPLQGADYITRLLTPIDLSVVYMLLRSGWSINHIFRTMIQRMGHLENAVLASRAVSGRIPTYKPFLKLISAFRKIQYNDNVTIETDQINAKFAIKLTIKDYKKLSVKQRTILRSYNVTANSPNLWFVSSPSKEKNQIFVETRTVMGLLNYLSKGVDVPEQDVASKIVRMTYYPDGKPFDWHVVTKDMIRIKTSRSKPMNAFVAVSYRHSWFFISDDDISSKETLDLLSIITGIYQGNIKSFLPVFTVS